MDPGNGNNPVRNGLLQDAAFDDAEEVDLIQLGHHMGEDEMNEMDNGGPPVQKFTVANLHQLNSGSLKTAMSVYTTLKAEVDLQEKPTPNGVDKQTKLDYLLLTSEFSLSFGSYSFIPILFHFIIFLAPSSLWGLSPSHPHQASSTLSYFHQSSLSYFRHSHPLVTLESGLYLSHPY